jgi:hypothetical protein
LAFLLTSCSAKTNAVQSSVTNVATATSTNQTSVDSSSKDGTTASTQTVTDASNSANSVSKDSLSLDEVYIPGYSTPLKLGISLDELKGQFTVTQSDDSIYVIGDKNVKVLLQNNTVHMIAIKNTDCIINSGLSIGCRYNDVIDALGNPLSNASSGTTESDLSTLTYYFNSQGTQCKATDKTGNLQICYMFKYGTLVAIILQPQTFDGLN